MPCNDQPSASTAARPPSVVALPPAATITCLKPSRRATAISSPVPRVLARNGSLRPDTSAKPLARAISMTAIPPGNTPHSASTGSPSGPVTRATRREPPRAASKVSSVPSPPSASGNSTMSTKPARRSPAAIAAAASLARNVPRNLSGHATARTLGIDDTSNRFTAHPAVVASGAPLLERVPLLEKHLDDFDGVVEPGTLERIRELAAPLQGKRVLHVNATAYGGGVAELLSTHVPLLRDVGIEADWQVMHGSDEFFAVTKHVHNALQGAEVEWTSAMEHTYLERVLDNALQLEGDWDYVVIHDPQPAAMLEYARNQGVAHESTKWIWRCHIDLTDASPDVWKFFQPFVEQYDATVWTMPEFVPASMPRYRTVFAPPCIDPLSVKNLELPRPFVEEITRQYGIRPRDPLIVQVSRFDPWKDPIGVIEAFHILREEFTTAQLLLAG